MKNVKIVFIAIALLAAVVITVKYGLGGEDIPDTEEGKSQWLCSSCDHSFQMSPKEEADSREVAQAAGLAWPPADCRGCNEHTAYRAQICGTCESPFLAAGIEGSSGKCTVCFPDAPAYEPDEEEEYEEGGERRKIHAI